MDSRKAALLSSIRPPLKAKTMMAEIIAVEDGESRAGRLQTVVTLAPIEGDYPKRDLALRAYIQRPDEDTVDPSALATMRRKGHDFLRAIDPEFPSFPKRVGKGVWQDANGATLDYAAYEKAVQNLAVAVFDGLAHLGADEDYRKSLVGKRVFMTPQEAKLEDGKLSQFVGRISGDLRTGETFLTEDLVDEAKLNQAVEAAAAAFGGDNE